MIYHDARDLNHHAAVYAMASAIIAPVIDHGKGDTAQELRTAKAAAIRGGGNG